MTEPTALNTDPNAPNAFNFSALRRNICDEVLRTSDCCIKSSKTSPRESTLSTEPVILEKVQDTVLRKHFF